MFRSGWLACAWVVAALTAGCAVFSARKADAGAYQWWTWTGEAGDNTFSNINDWRWSKQNDSVYYSGNWGTDDLNHGYVHPLYVTGNSGVNVISERVGLFGSSQPGGSHTVNMPAGQSYSFTGSFDAIGGGILINVNGGALSFPQGIGDSGVWVDPFAYATNNVQNYYQNNPNFAPSTIEVTSGGSLSIAEGINNNAYSSGSSNGYSYAMTGNSGVFVNGKATVNITGIYGTGSNNSSNYYGGGFLTVEGYDPASSINISNLEFEPANQTANLSGPGTLNVILDSTNGHGTSNNFNTVTCSGWLNIPTNVGGSYPAAPANFNLLLSDYTPQAGDAFQIISATTLESGVVTNSYGSGPVVQPGQMAAITVGGSSSVSWNTPFSVPGSQATFEFQQSYRDTGSQPGVWLEVVSVPEPSALALLAVGAAAIAAWRRLRF